MGLAFAQAVPGVADARFSYESSTEVGVDYNHVRQCGCLSLNGGNVWIAQGLTSSIAVVAEVSAYNASNINGSGDTLTLTSYLAGPRYRWSRWRPFTPFGQVLFGGAHAGGSAIQAAFSGSSNAFAMVAGGGLDVRISRHFAVRAIQADYYMTHFANSVNEPQNFLRLGAGVVFTLR
jgi:outer membrane immunogenic protein